MKFELGGDSGQVTAEDLEEKRQARLRVSKNADPSILARIDRWIHHRMVPINPTLPMALREQKTHFDRLADWYCGYLGVRAEFEPSYEQSQDLKECVPQAVLRDIYRPVRGSIMVEPYYHDLQLDPGGRNGLKEARAALKREPLPTVEPAILDIVAEQRRRRRFLKRPWQSFRPDDAPRRFTDQDTGLLADARTAEPDDSDD
jgi:hypothetical protein